jgi:hypothetical protein
MNNKQWKLNKYFTQDEITKLSEAFRKQVFNCSGDKIVMVIAANHYGDGSFPVVTDEKKTFIMQCGLIYNNFLARIDEVANGEVQETNLADKHYRK